MACTQFAKAAAAERTFAWCRELGSTATLVRLHQFRFPKNEPSPEILFFAHFHVNVAREEGKELKLFIMS